METVPRPDTRARLAQMAAEVNVVQVGDPDRVNDPIKLMDSRRPTTVINHGASLDIKNLYLRGRAERHMGIIPKVASIAREI